MAYLAGVADIAFSRASDHDRLGTLYGAAGAGMNAFSRVRVDAGRFLEVGEHIIDVDTLRIVTKPGAKLTPKGAALLLRLAHAGGRTLSRDELLDDIWKGTCPTPDVLTQAIKDLRRALADDLHAPRYIETLPRLGYRLIAPVRFVDDPAVAAASPTPPQPPRTAARAPSRLPRLRGRGLAAALIGCAILLLAAIGFAALHTSGSDSAAGVSRWHASAQRSITAEPGPENFPSISPDGSRVAYSVGDQDKHAARIVQRSMDQSHVVRLTAVDAGNEYYPVWSPDGTAISFMRYSGDDCKIMMLPALGGPERFLDSCYAGLVNPFSWTPDGKSIVTTIPSKPGVIDMKIISGPIAGGRSQWLSYQHDLTDIDLDARYSPDSAWIAFRRGANPYSDLFLVAAAGGKVRQLTHLASSIHGYDWTRDSSALIFSSGQGGPQALYTVGIADDHIEALGVQPAQFPSAARASDTVVYEIPRVRLQLSQVTLQTAKESRDLFPSTGSDSAPALSPVDDSMVFVSDRGGAQQVWLHDASSDDTFPLTAASTPNPHYPAWRADGARIVVTMRSAAGGRLVEIDVASRIQRVLTSPDEDVRSGAYGTRPEHFVAVVNAKSHRTELIEFEFAKGHETSRRVLAHDVGRADPDAASGALYFTRITEPGLFRLDDRTDAETLVTKAIYPSLLDGWRVRGSEVFYIAPQATGSSEVHVVDPRVDSDRRVATLPGAVGDLNFDISRDGQSIIVARVVAEDTDVGAINLQRNKSE